MENQQIMAKKTGTTTVGLVCKDGIVLATDRRATMGYLIASKDVDKIFPLSDSIAMTVAGSVGDAQTLVRWMRSEIKLYELRNEQKMSVKAVATLLANTLSHYKFFPFFVQLLVAGYDKGKPRLFSADMLGGVTEEEVASTGSGSPIAYGVLENNFKPGKSVKENIPIAAKAVKAAMSRDAASGENVDVCIITEKGFKRLKREEVVKILG